MDHDVQPRRRVGIIGAGRVGRVLAHASRSAGLELAAAWSRTPATRERFAAEFGIATTDTFDAAVTGVDVLFVAVPDDQAAAVLADLARCIAARVADDAPPAPLVALVSGSVSIEVGAPVARAGAHVVRVHPLRNITDSSGHDALEGVVAAITAGDARDLDAARDLATRLGMVPFELADARSATWHAAGSIAAGGVTTLLAIARDLATDAGMEPDQALQAMGALALAAIERAIADGPGAALTGPIVRGDSSTVAAHLEALGEGRPEHVEAYAAVARATLRLAVGSERIGPEGRARIGAVVGEPVEVGTWS